MIMTYRQGGKGANWVPTLTPDYLFLVNPYPFLAPAEEAFLREPGPGPAKESMRYAAQAIADQMVDSAIKKDRLREKIVAYAEAEILGPLAGALDLAIAPGASRDTEQSLLIAMCARDLARFWITPLWRVQLSYRQLVQSRYWTKAVSDPAWQPLLRDLCALEAEIQDRSTAFIEGELFPRYLSPMIELGVSTLEEAGSQQKPAVLQNVMMLVLVNALAARVAAPIEEDFNTNPNLQRVLPDNVDARQRVEWMKL
jgi:hypothetical protein